MTSTGPLIFIEGAQPWWLGPVGVVLMRTSGEVLVLGEFSSPSLSAGVPFFEGF